MTEFIQVIPSICFYFLTSKMEILIVYTPIGLFWYLNKVIYINPLTTMPAINQYVSNKYYDFLLFKNIKCWIRYYVSGTMLGVSRH